MKVFIRFISFTLVLILGLSVLPVNTVSANGNGELLRELGILKGDLDGNLLLDQPLKRQDVIVLLSRLLGVEELAASYPGEHSFSDVTDPYYDPFIAWAEDSGLTEGIGGGLFGFNQYLKNQQLLAFLLRALGYEYYGADYGLVPGKSVELGISPSGENWNETTTRQLMADRTVALLRKGRVKYGNITLERSLVLSDEGMPSDGQLFSLEEFEYKNGSAILTFAAPANDHNSSRSNTTRAMIDNGPSVGDLEMSYKVSGSGHVTVLKLTEQFYDSTTGQMLATFPVFEIPDGSTVEISVNYIENRENILESAATLINRKRPGGRVYSTSQARLVLEDILRDLLPAFTGRFSSEELNDETLKPLASTRDNPLFQANTMSGENPLYTSNGDSGSISSDIILLDSALEPDPDGLFVFLFQDGEQIDIESRLTITKEDGGLGIEITDLAAPDNSDVRLTAGYIKLDGIDGEVEDKHGISEDELRQFLDALILNLHLSTKPDSLGATNVFGKVTLNLVSFKPGALTGKSIAGVIVGNSISNPELDDEIIVALLDDTGNMVHKIFKVHDYGDRFIDENDAFAYFQRYLDPDSDDDGILDLVYRDKKKPIVVSKPVDKATPLLMLAGGGLGDNVNLVLENGEVLFWYDGRDDDCDGLEDETHLHTTTYWDTITVDRASSSLRTGRNPQTGKEIKIAAETVIVVSEANGEVSTMSREQFLADFSGDGRPDLAKVVADSNDYAIMIHIIKDATVAFVDRSEQAAGGPIVVYTNSEELSQDDIDYLISDENETELFVFRQEFGPVQASSYRWWTNKKMAEVIEYIPEGTRAGEGFGFKPGKAIMDKVNVSGNPDNDCDDVNIGDPPQMHDYFIKFDGIDGEAKAVLVVDSFFDIFTELSVDFRGHVTVLK